MAPSIGPSSWSPPMSRRILLLQGHPDRSSPHLCHGLETAYADGARGAGHDLNPFGCRKLTSRSARMVATMGMPALVDRFLYRARSLKSLERNILGFAGIAPIHETPVGGTRQVDAQRAARLFGQMGRLGRNARSAGPGIGSRDQPPQAYSGCAPCRASTPDTT